MMLSSLFTVIINAVCNLYLQTKLFILVALKVFIIYNLVWFTNYINRENDFKRIN